MFSLGVVGALIGRRRLSSKKRYTSPQPRLFGRKRRRKKGWF